MMSEIVNVENEIIECPICMDQVEGMKNRVTTECGHCFHTSCLMKNVAHNGFGCPYCRDAMAQEPDDNNTDEEYDEFSVDEEDEEPDYSDNVLRGSRWLFQRAEGEELDDYQRNSDIYLEYIVEKLVQRGVSMADLVKAILIRDHDEYQFHDEFERVDDELFGKFRVIISNYQPPVPVPDLPVSLVEDQAPVVENRSPVDKNDPNLERFCQYCDSFYSSVRMSRYQRMSQLIQEEKEEDSTI